MTEQAQATSHRFTYRDEVPGSQEARPFERAAQTPTVPNTAWCKSILAMAG